MTGARTEGLLFSWLLWPPAYSVAAVVPEKFLPPLARRCQSDSFTVHNHLHHTAILMQIDKVGHCWWQPWRLAFQSSHCSPTSSISGRSKSLYTTSSVWCQLEAGLDLYIFCIQSQWYLILKSIKFARHLQSAILKTLQLSSDHESQEFNNLQHLNLETSF